jgi:hypothetical protein
LPQLFAKILFQQMPQGLSNAVNWIQSELLVAWKATYLDMQPSMRLADKPNPGATGHNYFLWRP